MSRPHAKVTLIHHPTVALRIDGFTDSRFEALAETGAYLGNVYRRIIPPSLPRVASVLERDAGADVRILDLRMADYRREEVYRNIPWEGYRVETRRVGAAFTLADEAIAESDWVGFSSHFTFESGIVRDLIAHAKRVNPAVRVMVGGADVIARPMDYLRYGADMAFAGDFDPHAFAGYAGEPVVVRGYRHPFTELTLPAFDKLSRLADYDESHDGPVPEGVAFPIAFTYFTRGCPRECDFCESRRTGFESLDLDAAIGMLEHYWKAGIRTLNFSDDNLLILGAKKETRGKLLAILQAMRDIGFAWEYPNGLEVGRLHKAGELDETMMEALFSHTKDPVTGRITGAYRVYVPIETFDRRDRYSKLKPIEDQRQIIARLAGMGLPEADFGVVIPTDADENTFLNIREGYRDVKEIMQRGGNTQARYSAFHLIPIALYRSMPTKYSVETFPEGWNFYFPVYDGQNFTARELFERRLELMQEIDPQNYESMKQGQYSYS